MQRVLLATTNKSKYAPFNKAWSALGLDKNYELVSLMDLGDKKIEVVEDTGDFEADAVKKATEYAKSYNLISISIDRGIEIPNLNNWPGTKTKGVFSGTDDSAFLLASVKKGEVFPDSAYDQDVFRSNLILRKIGNDRKVNSAYGIAIYGPEGKGTSEKIIVEGIASDTLRITDRGYYYDWFFIPIGQTKTLSELTDEEYIDFGSKVLWPIPQSVINFLETYQFADL